MYRRICILVLTLLAAQSVCFARTVGPGVRSPDRVSPGGFSPDSLNTATSERNQRLYDIGKEKEALYAKEEMTEADGIRACELEEEYAELGGWEAESDASRILQGLGVGTEFHSNDMATLDARLKVKVLLAQALFGNPDILLLDEPNSALDFENTGLLFRRVRELVETGERTALIVLHDPALALRWCRRLLLLAGGRLVDNVATEGMGAEALQAVLRQLYPTIQVRRDKSGRFYCLPD